MERYQYKECGLDNIWLVNGFKFVETPEGSGVAISNARQLNRAIGACLIDETRPLSHKEFRFLRVEMDLSQKRIAELFFVDPQTVGRWERNESEIPGAADVLIRLIYKDFVNGDPAVCEFIQKLADLDRSVCDEVNLEHTQDGWKRAA